MLLAAAAFIINAATRPKGLAPFLLAYETLPLMAIGDASRVDCQRQQDRAKILHESWAERETIAVEQRASRAQERRRPSIDKIFERPIRKQLALPFREESERWEGPHMLSRVHAKAACVFSSQDKKEHPLPATHVKELQTLSLPARSPMRTIALARSAKMSRKKISLNSRSKG